MSPGRGSFVASVGALGRREWRRREWGLMDGCRYTVARSGLRTSANEGCSGVLAVRTTYCHRWARPRGDPVGRRDRKGGGELGVVLSLSLSCDGARLASGSDHGNFRVSDTTTGALLRTIAVFDEFRPDCLLETVTVHFSPTKSRLLLCAGPDHWVFGMQFEVDSGQEIECEEGLAYAVFPPYGQTMATGGWGDPDVLLVGTTSHNGSKVLLTTRGC